MNVCPECKSKIYNPQASFCYKCGYRIKADASGGDTSNDINPNSNNLEAPVKKSYEKVSSANFTIRDDSIDKSSVEEHPIKNDNLSKRWNIFVVGVNALSVMFLVVALGLFFRSNSGTDFTSLKPLVEVNNVEINDEVADLFESTVMKNKYYTVVPKDVFLYVESSNLNEFLSGYLSDDQKNYLAKTYELSFEDFLVFMGLDYAYVKDKNGDVAVILQVGGFDFFERTYSKYQENKTNDAPIITKRVGEFLVISESSDLINTLDEVVAKVSSSLEQDSTFSTAIKTISQKPVFFVYSSSDYKRDELNSDLEDLGLQFLDDEVSKTASSAFYVVKDGEKFIVKEAD